MRKAQVILFMIGTASLIASAFGFGKDYGETFLKAGLAILLIDIVFILLWPSVKHQ